MTGEPNSAEEMREATIRHIMAGNCLVVVCPVKPNPTTLSTFECEGVDKEDALLALLEAELAIEKIREAIVSTFCKGRPASYRTELEVLLEQSKRCLRDSTKGRLWGRMVEVPKNRQKGDE